MVKLIAALLLAWVPGALTQSANEDALFDTLQNSVSALRLHCPSEKDSLQIEKIAALEANLSEVEKQIRKETPVPGMAPWHGLTVTCENFHDLATEREEEAEKYCAAHAAATVPGTRSQVLSRLFETMQKDFQALVNNSKPSCQTRYTETGALLASLFAALEPLSGNDGLGVALAGKAFFQTVPAAPSAITARPKKPSKTATP